MEIISTIVKRILLPAVFIYILSAGLTGANESVSASDQSKYIMDNNEMFTKSDIERMNKALAGRSYDVYVMTASGLNEQEGIQLVNRSYDAGGYGENQLLLLITKSPNYVHLVFENEKLAARIASSSAGDVQGVIDTQFVPYAKNGDLAGGVIAVSQYVNGLRDLSNHPSLHTDSGHNVPGNDQPTGSERSNQLNKILYGVGGLIVVVGIVVLVIRPVIKAKRRQKRSRIKKAGLQPAQHLEMEDAVESDKHQAPAHAALSLFAEPDKNADLPYPPAVHTSKRQPRWIQPEEIESIRLKLLERIQKEQLMIPPLDDPFGLLDRAKQSCEQLQKLSAASRDDSSASWSPERVEQLRSIEHDVYEAEERVAQLLFFRNEALQAVEQAQQQLDEFHLLPDQYERETRRIQESYAEVHLHEHQQWYADIQQQIEELKQLLTQLVQTLDMEQQQYRQAGEYTVQVHTVMDHLIVLHRKIILHADELDLRKKQAMEQWESLSTQHRSAVQQLAVIKADPLLTQQIQHDSFAALEQARKLLLTVPLNLNKAEQALDQAAGQLYQFLLQTGQFAEDLPASSQLNGPDWSK